MSRILLATLNHQLIKTSVLSRGSRVCNRYVDSSQAASSTIWPRSHQLIRTLFSTPIDLSSSSSSSSAGDGGKKKGGFWNSLTGKKRSADSACEPGQKSSSNNRDRGQIDNTRKSGNVNERKFNNNNRKTTGGEKDRRRRFDEGEKNRASNKNNMQLRSASKKDNKSPLGQQVSKSSERLGKRSTFAGSKSASNFVDSAKSIGDRIMDKFTGTGQQVKHDEENSRFVMDLGNGQFARIDYRVIKDGQCKQIEMFHTEVPEELRGRGIARALAQGALQQAQRANMKYKLTCSYLVDYINKCASEEERKLLID